MQHQLTQHIHFDASDILSSIKGNTQPEKLSRLSVYKNNVFHSLSSAMQEIFPVTRQMLGEECFQALCYHYICQAPPSSPVLSEYGGQFANFIHQQAELTDYPYLGELAKLEYELLQLTHREEEPIIAPQTIAQQLDNLAVPPEESHWQLASYVELYEAPYRVGTLYQAFTEKEDPQSITNLATQEWLVLCKHNLWGTFYIISYQEWLMLRNLQQGMPLSEASEHLAQEEWVSVFQNIIQKPLTIAIR